MAFRDLERRLVRRQAAAARFELGSNRVSLGVDELHVVAPAERHGATLQEPVIDSKAVFEGLRTSPERVVDLPPQLVADDEEDDEGRGNDRERNSRGGDERQTRSETEVSKIHGSRSA